jgi:queuine tRNA-ribosyltransferase
MSSPKIFTIKNKHSHSLARRGEVKLPNGTVQTPVFMPIGTLGTVKSLTKFDLEKIGFEIILGNTYHLWLKPDMETFEKCGEFYIAQKNTLGNLHRFQSWNRPILTDSGGFQAWSLSKIRKFTEEGVRFKVPDTGDIRFLSPEISMQIQTTFGSDIALVLDEALSAEVTEKEARRAMYRTRRWAERSQLEFERLRGNNPHDNLLFGIPQGAQFPALRKESALLSMELDLPGYSIGGVANGGEPEEIMYNQVLSQTEVLEEHKPRHLLGVGTPKDIIEMVKRGIDMFDCVYPTRNARHGSVFIWTDRNKLEYVTVKVSGKRWENDFNPINSNSKFEELQTYSRAYIRHLFRAKELLAMRLATLINLEFYYELMETIRSKIENDEVF